MSDTIRMDDRPIDAVSFTVQEAWVDYTYTAQTDTVTSEEVRGSSELQSITVYAEGEFVCEYERGEWVDDEDVALVRIAAHAANVYVIEGDDGSIQVPAGEA